MIIIRLVATLYPFVRELLVGKYSDNKDFRNFKVVMIIIGIVSILLNYFLIKSAYANSEKDAINKTRIESLQRTVNYCGENISKEVNKTGGISPITNTNQSTTKPSKPDFIKPDELEGTIDDRLKKLNRLD